jgi:DNA mismatch repair protein MutH
VNPLRRPPPLHLAELAVRAEALAGRTLGEIARALDVSLDGPSTRTKGRVGELLERALGATAGAGAAPDFPHLGVELKTVPVDEAGAPRESTFVCSIRLVDADHARWESSAARAKLAHVLFVPVIAAGVELAARRIGRPRFFRPTAAQEAVLRADFEDLVGAIGAGGADELSAHRGRWLQVRPKAANGSVRTLAPGEDGALVETGPRGFYLRRHFVAAVLADPQSLPA